MQYNLIIYNALYIYYIIQSRWGKKIKSQMKFRKKVKNYILWWKGKFNICLHDLTVSVSTNELSVYL